MSGSVLLCVVAGAALAQTPKPPSRSECICMAVCQTLANPGRVVTQPGRGCPNIHDELIYDNMARCVCCPTPRQPERKGEFGRESPNH
ncbi:hypothetical protein FGK63_17695 [Ruegeria sediminis]|uniref:Secreted protein n=1 Tax=Ruegeria sediminis TaxID=2583820 RepID=A0ABY2WTQ3_9RHOB|nr:hypothetical protein [Ruegeria sediminis]TMV04912.1 hypothetical protein FGK63_17695 [Ruegeria sediminis]